jgi:hypothetical protein
MSAQTGWRRWATSGLVDPELWAWPRVDRRVLVGVTLTAIVVFGGWLRLSGADWDQGRHLHPDERYLTQVATAIQWPSSPWRYLDVERSPLSPYNTEVGEHYVYGQLPLFGAKLFATALGDDDYPHLNVAGRRLSALIDVGSIVLVFLLGRIVFARFGEPAATAGALLAAALYAVTVTAVQSAHFFTTDAWLTFFGLATVLVSARAVQAAVREASGYFDWAHVLVGVGLGLTVACKASGLLVAIPVVLGLLGECALVAGRSGALHAYLRTCAAALTVLVAGYVAYRAVSPYSFAHSNWFDFHVNPAYRDALREQRDAVAGKFLYPPSYQWLLSPRIWDPFRNLVVWQLGLALGAAAVAGLCLMLATLVRPLAQLWRRSTPPRIDAAAQAELTVLLMICAFVLAVFGYVATRFGHTGRYLVPLAPFAALAAAYGLLRLHRASRAAIPVTAAVLVASVAYAVAYHHIYTVPTTRVAASNWILEHVPSGSTVVNEHWDDSLPVGAGADRYTGVTLPVFDADDDTKLKKLYAGIRGADYYFVSSPRAWRTVGRLPDRFPIMPRFYRALFDGRLGFVRVASFETEPELFGLQLHDLGAEEAFWVYDHPPVQIYKRYRPLGWGAFRRLMCEPAPSPAGCA